MPIVPDGYSLEWAPAGLKSEVIIVGSLGQG